MDVHARGYLGLPAAVRFDLRERPTCEGEVRGAAVLERVPGVDWYLCLRALCLEPAVEGGLAYGEDFLGRGSGAGFEEK